MALHKPCPEYQGLFCRAGGGWGVYDGAVRVYSGDAWPVAQVIAVFAIAAEALD